MCYIPARFSWPTERHDTFTTLPDCFFTPDPLSSFKESLERGFTSFNVSLNTWNIVPWTIFSLYIILLFSISLKLLYIRHHPLIVIFICWCKEIDVIFAEINIRGRLKSLLKIKGVFRDISVRFGGINSENRGFGPGLWDI
jgi:hypothetical protein